MQETTRPGSTNGLTHIRTTPSEINIPKDPRRSRASRCLRKTSGRLDRKEHRHPRGSRGEADDALRHQAACEVKGTTTDSQTPSKQVQDQKTFPRTIVHQNQPQTPSEQAHDQQNIPQNYFPPSKSTQLDREPHLFDGFNLGLEINVGSGCTKTATTHAPPADRTTCFRKSFCKEHDHFQSNNFFIWKANWKGRTLGYSLCPACVSQTTSS